jgi:hypothetical protein
MTAMTMRVLIKEVPCAAVRKRIDPAPGRIDRSGERNLNAYDTHAIEAAMQLREGRRRGRRDRRRHDGAGQRRLRPPQAGLARRHRSVHLYDDALAGSDVAATGYALTGARRCSGGSSSTSSCSVSSRRTASATRSEPSSRTTCRCRRSPSVIRLDATDGVVRELCDQVALGEDFVEFLTLPAYELLT